MAATSFTERKRVNVCELPAEFRHHPRLAGHEWQLRKSRVGRHTRICEYVATTGERRVFVKQFPAPGEDGRVDRRLVREFRSLRVLRRSLGPALSESVPEPVAMIRSGDCLVLGEIPGTSLARLLKRDANCLSGVARLGPLRRRGQVVGEWLRRFQQATAGQDLPHDHERFRAELDRDLEHLSAVSTAEIDRIRRTIAEASGRLAGRTLPAAGRHSDFLPQNIIMDGAAVGVVDFENYRQRDIAHRDPGSFLAYLALLERRVAYLPWALRSFASGFLTGFGPLARAPAQSLFTAAAAVRIARDTADPGVESSMLTVVSGLSLTDIEQEVRHTV